MHGLFRVLEIGAPPTLRSSIHGRWRNDLLLLCYSLCNIQSRLTKWSNKIFSEMFQP